MGTPAAGPHAWLRALIPALLVPAAILLVSLVQLTWLDELAEWGIVPRDLRGLVGIALAPFLHGSGDHLVSNLLPLTLQLVVVAQLYPSFWREGLAWIWLGGHTLVWLFARPGNHLGGSGLVFGLTGLLLVSGLLRKERGAMTAALLALFLNQGLVWGMLPFNSSVSWEAHAFSFGVGALVAWQFRGLDQPPADDDTPDDSADGGNDDGVWNYERMLRPTPEQKSHEE